MPYGQEAGAGGAGRITPIHPEYSLGTTGAGMICMIIKE